MWPLSMIVYFQNKNFIMNSSSFIFFNLKIMKSSCNDFEIDKIEMKRS